MYNNTFTHQSFSVLKPYPALLHSFFPFRNKLIFIARRSRSRKLFSTPSKDAQSSSDIILISTTEHRDGSLVFRFGDASEIVDNNDVVEEIASESRQESTFVTVLENDDVEGENESNSRQESTIVKVLENDDLVEEIERKSRQESTIVKILDGDQEREVIVKRIERGYGSDDVRLTEVADAIRTADTDGGIDETETKFVSDPSDFDEESSDTIGPNPDDEILQVTDESVDSSQSEAKQNDSLEFLLDETDSTAQLDKDESSNPTISLFDNSPNRDKSADTDGTPVKDGDDETEDPSVSVNFESMQVLKVENMNVKQPYDENESDKVKSEDTVEGDSEGLMPSASITISDVKLTDAANEDIEEALQDMNISEGTLIDEMPPSDILGVEPTLDVVEVKMEDELQEVSTNNKEENDVSYVLPTSRKEESELSVEQEEVSQIQSAPLELKPTMEVSDIEIQDSTGQYPDDEILQLKEESDDLSVSVKPETIKVSDTEFQDTVGQNLDGILHVTDESEDPSVSVKIETNEVSDIEVQDAKGPNFYHESLQVEDESEDQSVSGKLETIKVSNNEFQDTVGPDLDDGILQVTEESEDPSVFVKLETIQVSDIELQDSMGQNPDDEVLQITEESENPSVSVKFETNQISNIELQDTMDLNPDDGILEVTEESDNPSVAVKLETIQNSDIELLDTMGQNPDDGILQAIDDSEDPSVSIKLETSQVSDIESQDTMGPSLDDVVLQVTDDSEDPSVSLNLETSQVSDIELQDTTVQKPGDEILQVNDESEDPSVSVELETVQVSNNEVMDVTQAYGEVELDKVENEDTREGDAKDLLSPATMHDISDVKLTDTANGSMEELLQDMNISEGVLIDGMLSSYSVGPEPTVDKVIQFQSSDVDVEAGMEVSTTNDMDVKDWSVDDELQQVSIDNRDEIDVADVTTFQEQDSILLEPKPTKQVSDVQIQDFTCQNIDDGILRVIDKEAGDSFTMDVEQLSYKLEAQPILDEGENHSILEQCAETDVLGISILVKQDARDPLPEAEKTEENVSISELAEASEDSTALLLASEPEVKREEIYLTNEFLTSGAALLEHPFKALAGGDDAYFVAGDNWLGVASGVSRWSFEGTDPGVYAQELMKTCEDIVLNTNVPVTNPVELLCRGVKETNMSGSSNVLIANFDGQALHVANIGDTGFLIIRHGAIYKKSSPLLHEFHFALQVEDGDDPLQLVEECRIDLEEGDIVVSATDGLFDNLYEREIAMIVSKSLQAEIKPQEIANILATRAQEVGKSASVRSPNSDSAQAAGYTGYVGGKPDNVAVIVSLVEKRSNLMGE